MGEGGGANVRPLLQISIQHDTVFCKMFYSSLHWAIVNNNYSNINLKPKQVKCLEAVYSNKDVIAVLPTGYGKSLIFHILPSLFYDKFVREEQKNKPVILVVLPLNTLIENQIKRSCQGHIKAGVLNVKKGKDTDSLHLDFSGNQSLLKDAK